MKARIVSPMFNRSSIFLFGSRIFLGFIFAYSGLLKLLDPIENFRGLLADYTILPYFSIPWFALIMPWLELIAGVFLMVGLAVRQSALLLSFFSISFMVVLLLSRWILGISPASCGCFGEGGLRLTTNQVLILDALDFLIGLRLFLHQRHPWSMDSFFKK